ncbi:hypothetical protein [Rhodococcoides kyotonense]|uniref:Uncharacterized protein n=1 Tax=Rhodococcoides kyotonense TaxID=398843 RepID=A0A239KVC8_9NOCA|nr:hypothetical protein [Rhodococcus kyotonensis]SNT21960.1 hypothetical protein SAMN05421642_111118 [Rhodococcus kyotonensis]
MKRVAGLVEGVVLVAAAVGLCAVVGIASPRPVPGVSTDRLGPDTGETVTEYVDRSRAGVAELTDTEQHWALVSFDTYLSPRAAAEAAGGERIAQVVIRVPLDRVQTRVLTIGVPGSVMSVVDALDVAATELNAGVGQWDRQSQIDAASVSRLADGCDCVVGLVVRADPSALSTMADSPGVRAVEALPADARAGHFAVRAFLPDYTDVVGALPDDGPIPPP